MDLGNYKFRLLDGDHAKLEVPVIVSLTTGSIPIEVVYEFSMRGGRHGSQIPGSLQVDCRSRSGGDVPEWLKTQVDLPGLFTQALGGLSTSNYPGVMEVNTYFFGEEAARRFRELARQDR